MKYNHYGPGFGTTLNNDLLKAYHEKIDSKLEIFDFDMTAKQRKDIEDTLQKSLKNGKTFYSNAPEYIRESMREYERLMKEGVLF